MHRLAQLMSLTAALAFPSGDVRGADPREARFGTGRRFPSPAHRQPGRVQRALPYGALPYGGRLRPPGAHGALPYQRGRGAALDVRRDGGLVIAVGTGKSLKIWETGDVDVVFVHARSLEAKFVADGLGVDRYGQGAEN